jgi:hypothetical protein
VEELQEVVLVGGCSAIPAVKAAIRRACSDAGMPQFSRLLPAAPLQVQGRNAYFFHSTRLIALLHSFHMFGTILYETF